MDSRGCSPNSRAFPRYLVVHDGHSPEASELPTAVIAAFGHQFPPSLPRVIPSFPPIRSANALPERAVGAQPHLTYREILTTMVDANLHRTPREFVPEARRTLATILTFLLPKGCLIRTAQVRI